MSLEVARRAVYGGRYDAVLYAIGLFSGLVPTSLILFTDVDVLLALSLGFNLTLFLFAHTLHEGWHELE